jgi:hypothetical protein
MADAGDTAKGGRGVSLWMKPSKSRYARAEPVVLEYGLLNESGHSIFVVDDRQYTLCLRDPAAMVCDAGLDRCTLNTYLAEIPLGPSVHIAGYAPPSLRQVHSGATLRATVTVPTPLKQTILNESNELEDAIMSMAEDVTVRVSVGYGWTEFIPDLRTFDTLDQFLKWQRIVESADARVSLKA